MKITKIIAISLIACVGSNTAYAAGWISDKKGCKHYNPNPIPNESVTWTGSCKNGFANGSGRLTWYKSGKKGNSKYGTKIKGKWDTSDADSDAALIGAAIGAAAVVGGLMWLFGDDSDSSSSSNSNSHSSSSQSTPNTYRIKKRDGVWVRLECHANGSVQERTIRDCKNGWWEGGSSGMGGCHYKSLDKAAKSVCDI